MEKKKKELIILLIIGLIFATFYWLMVIKASARVGEIRKNPDFIPVLLGCSAYNSQCGRDAKRIWEIYGNLCMEPNYRAKTCDFWYDESQLNLIFNK